MQKARMAIIVTITLLASLVVFLLIECFLFATDLKITKASLKEQEISGKSAYFANLFINKVLLSTGTIDFESRLQLENAVRDLNDKEILTQWQKFTNSQGDAETQKTVGNILKLLINKMSPKTALDTLQKKE